MNTSKLKSYAPAARRDFINAVTERANNFGIDADKTESADVQGDIAIIAGRPFPVKIMEQRNRLIERVQRDGFELTMRKVAYTWFNRFMALRYMELHNYLDHGFRVLSNPSGSQTPEILEQAAHVELAGLDRDKVVELKLDGTKDAELYRMLIVAECNTLNRAMPFLFEAIDGPSELLLPDNLLHSDSLIRKLVTEIDEEDWQQIEIIGWLYQFYISDKKDEVIGKVVKSEDIPAATQLFTPNWIVKYMVQNSLGAQWLATYPDSSLKGGMEYYIEPAEQTDEVNEQLAAITPDTLDPEALTLIDPACGSGHILVEAYELFKAIYLERGYRQRDVAQLILEKNLFGLDIDERAAQMTGFALMMKGRADDRRLFERGVTLNVMALVDSVGFDAESLVQGVSLAEYGLKPNDLMELKQLFEHATTFGSLIQVSEGLAEKLLALRQLSDVTSQDLFVSEALKRLGPLVRQAELLATQYDAVVANPPYMGGKGMNALVKEFAKGHFPDAKSDLFACFIERGFTLAKHAGHNAMVTMQSWMFLSSFEQMRERMLRDKTITTMAQIGYNSFPSMNSKVARATVFTVANRHLGNYAGVFIDLNSAPQSADKEVVFLARNPSDRYEVSVWEFAQIPGSPIAYATSPKVRNCFLKYEPLENEANVKLGITPGQSERFLRLWQEVSLTRICVGFNGTEPTSHKWYPTNKGGSFRRWYGNNEYVMDWFDDGQTIRNLRDDSGRQLSFPRSLPLQFKPHVTWTRIAPSVSFRYHDQGFLFTDSAVALFCEDELAIVHAFLNTVIVKELAKQINPTLNYQAGDIAKLPLYIPGKIPGESLQSNQQTAVVLSRNDWDAYERSWDFQSLPILTASSEPTPTLESSYTAWITQNRDTITEMKRLEEENNRLFIDAYGLADELDSDVPIEQITLTVNPAYRYGGKLTEEDLWTRFRQDTIQELVSYAIGGMMGRYSLDAPGLIYANSGNEGFDSNRYSTFPADDDGIVPVTDMDWFDDDAARRVREFLLVVWGADTLDENMEWLTENLGKKTTETAEETIRRYLSAKFFKDHLKTYKKRPIYWLFSSGKAKAFECLVYLHRYNESTLSRMRNEYVIPLQGKYAARADYLDNEVKQASSTSAQRKLQKELDNLKKKQTELTKYDEELRHFADQRISIDLDDGVKVNYSKFGGLLAEVKAVTGKK